MSYFEYIFKEFIDTYRKYQLEYSRLEKINPSSEHFAYSSCKEKIVYCENRLNWLFDEVNKVKHLVECVDKENIEHVEDLKYTENHLKKQDILLPQTLHMGNVVDLRSGVIINHTITSSTSTDIIRSGIEVFKIEK